jgi:alpha-tubulin suppressor-like RCC1 family protein
MSQIMEKFDVLNELNDEFKQRVKILYIFQDYDYILDRLKGNNVLIVTKDDKTYAFGRNYSGQLGFGHDKVVNEIQIVEELCDQQIIDFAIGKFHCIARNSSGKVFCWGYNIRGLLGIGSKDESYHKPILNQYLNNEFVIDISCGELHSLVLTNCGEVYAWGGNHRGQIGNGCNYNQLIPIKVKGFNNERVVMISCGSEHSMALTEFGHVYSWGYNEWGQLGIGNTEESNEPKFVAVIDENKCNVFIEKISCGSEHSLLLSSDGYIYAFGNNESGELGNKKKENELSPHRIKIETKFIDIKCHFSSNISIALSEGKVFYIWGKCEIFFSYYPSQVKSESFDDIFAEYLKITYRALDIEKLLKAETKCGNGRYSKEFEEMNSIAIGSYGIVCKARDKRTKKIFAIKKIPFIKDFEEKALKEIEIFPKLKSDLVVGLESVWIEENYLKLDDFKKEENTSFITSLEVFKPNKTLLLHIQMELCLMTLKEVTKKLDQELNRKHSEIMTPLGYYISSELFKEILEGVHYLHKQKVIHRDLKPNNVLITDGINGRFVKIADFGLATIHEFDGQSHTKYKGTIRYAAPEVMSSRKYDTKADIYSLGVILQEVFKIDINEYLNIFLFFIFITYSFKL